LAQRKSTSGLPFPRAAVELGADYNAVALHALVRLALLAAVPASPSPVLSPSPAATSAAETVLPVLDVVIVIVVLIALVIGYQRGVIQPVMTQAFFFGALFVIYRDRTDFLNAVQHYLHQGIAVAIFLALVIAVVAGYIGSVVGQALHRMPVARGIDGLLGVFVNALIWLVVIYYGLCAMIVLDRAFTPFVNQTKLTAAQVTTITNTIESNPIAAALVDPKDLKKLKDESKTANGASLSTVTQLDNLKNVYEDFVRPQLKGSRIAPYVMRLGQALHLGKFGAKDLPK
jgi:uncharacterized membrane protein required for colicin V production